MQFIPRNANDLAQEYMHRSEAAAQKNRVLAPILERNIWQAFRHIWMMLVRPFRARPTEAIATEVQEPLRKFKSDLRRSRSFSS